MSTAVASLERGNAAAARFALKTAINAEPENGQLRFLLARAQLLESRGDLAIISIQQANDRGIPINETLVVQGEALLQQERYQDLLAMESTELLSPEQLLHHIYQRTQALEKTTSSDSAWNNAVLHEYSKLLELADTLDANESASVRSLLEKQGSNAYLRSREHRQCTTQPTSYWQPLVIHNRRVIRVGKERDVKDIADAAKVAKDGDIIEIDSGSYSASQVVWPQNNIVVRGMGKRPSLHYSGEVSSLRDIWLFTGNSVVVENVELSGARSQYENGAAIRHAGDGLILRHVYLHNNENGLLTGNRFADTNVVVIEYSEFADNGDSKGQAHNIYVGRSKRFEMRFSYSRDAKVGHLVKSRAQENIVAYNRLVNIDNSSSYHIDFPEGGIATIVGNEFDQSANTSNHGIISFAAESLPHATNELTVSFNTVYNRDLNGIFVRNRRDQNVSLFNNLFGGAPIARSEGDAQTNGDLLRPEHGMQAPRAANYHLTGDAYAIDSAKSTPTIPDKEYVHPTAWKPRNVIWQPDVGAHERCGFTIASTSE